MVETIPSPWLDKQTGTVQSFEKVSHTFLNEDTGEMYCDICKQSGSTSSNHSRSFMIFINQTNAFERFTEQHLHGKKPQ